MLIAILVQLRMFYKRLESLAGAGGVVTVYSSVSSVYLAESGIKTHNRTFSDYILSAEAL